MQHVEVVLAAQVVGDVCEGCARRLGHAVVDDDHVVFICHWWRRRLLLLLQRVPPGGVLTVALLHLGQLMTGNRLFCKEREKNNRGFNFNALSNFIRK